MTTIVGEKKNGDILFPNDFTVCGTPDAIRSGLSRMCRNGLIYRYAKGIYYIPIIDKWDGSQREPSLDTVAHRIAERDNARIIPTGIYALNRLGLSTQVQTNIVYITDGSQRLMKFGKGKCITFKHSNDLNNFAYQSKVMQLVVMALREIGEKDLTEAQLSEIKNIIENSVSKTDFNHDIALAPIWIKKLLQK